MIRYVEIGKRLLLNYYFSCHSILLTPSLSAPTIFQAIELLSLSIISYYQLSIEIAPKQRCSYYS
jgi:hypothetical protein